jgi:hypothetical protein
MNFHRNSKKSAFKQIWPSTLTRPIKSQPVTKILEKENAPPGVGRQAVSAPARYSPLRATNLHPDPLNLSRSSQIDEREWFLHDQNRRSAAQTHNPTSFHPEKSGSSLCCAIGRWLAPMRGNDAEVNSENSREQLRKACGHRACGEARERWRARQCSANNLCVRVM